MILIGHVCLFGLKSRGGEEEGGREREGEEMEVEPFSPSPVLERQRPKAQWRCWERYPKETGENKTKDMHFYLFPTFLFLGPIPTKHETGSFPALLPQQFYFAPLSFFPFQIQQNLFVFIRRMLNRIANVQQTRRK